MIEFQWVRPDGVIVRTETFQGGVLVDSAELPDLDWYAEKDLSVQYRHVGGGAWITAAHPVEVSK